MLSILYAIFFLIISRQNESLGATGSWIILAMSGIFSSAAFVALYERLQPVFKGANMNADKIQENPITGMRTIVIETPEETGGRRVVVEYQLQPGTGRGYTVAHIHRRYVERFEILSGRAAYVLNGVTGAAIAGETVIVPIGTSHVHPWSVGDEPLVVRQTTEAVAPDVTGLNSALMAAETLIDLSHQGKVNANGQPNPLQAAVIFHDLLLPHSHLAGLPFAAQRVIFGVLSAVGRLLGYRAVYPAGTIVGTSAVQ